jgi:hypothetical protein
MNDTAIRNLSLASWARTVWEKELRGVPLQPHEAAVAYCMNQHREWRQYWNQLDGTSDNTKVINMLTHIYNDAAVKLQLDRNDPPEINSLYQSMRAKGIADIDALHVIAFVLQEQTWNAKTNGESFDMAQYVERVKSSVQATLEQPDFIRTGTVKIRS